VALRLPTPLDPRKDHEHHDTEDDEGDDEDHNYRQGSGISSTPWVLTSQ
jgi:hypothetical protein